MGGIDSTQTTTIKLVNLVAGQNLSLNSVTIYDFQTNASASEPPSATQTDADVSSGYAYLTKFFTFILLLSTGQAFNSKRRYCWDSGWRACSARQYHIMCFPVA